MIVFSEKRLIAILTLFILSGCLPDSFTKFHEDPPSRSTTVQGGSGGGTVPGSGTSECSASTAECVPPTGISMDNIEIILNNATNATFKPTIEGETLASGSDPGTAELLVWSINTTLPAGMTFNTEDGSISGVPTGFVSLPSVTITALHTPSGEARSATFSISAVHELESISYPQPSGQLIIVTLDSKEDYANFDVDPDDPNEPNNVNRGDVISEDGAVGEIIYIDAGDDDNPGEMHIIVTNESFKPGDKLSPNSTVYFEDPSNGPDGVIEDLIYAFETGTSLALTPEITPVLDPDEIALLEYDLSIPLKLKGVINISSDGTISMNATDTVDVTTVLVRARSTGADTSVPVAFKILRKDDNPTPKRITNIVMEQADNSKLILNLESGTYDESRFDPNTDANKNKDLFITSEYGKKAQIIHLENDRLFIDTKTLNSAAGVDNSITFKSGDNLDLGKTYFIGEAKIDDATASTPAFEAFTHAFKVDTSSTVVINPLITPQLIETSGVCDDIALADVANSSACTAIGGTFDTNCDNVTTATSCEEYENGATFVPDGERDSIVFTSYPDINNIGICVYDEATAKTQASCASEDNSEWYDSTGECIDNNLSSEETCYAYDSGATRVWKGLRYGKCSDGNPTTKSECLATSGNAWLSDGVVRGYMYYPLEAETVLITATDAKAREYQFNFNLSINAPPKNLSYNDMVVIPVNDVSKFNIGDFVTGVPDQTLDIEIFNSNGDLVDIGTPDCTDPSTSLLPASFSAKQSHQTYNEVNDFWFCPRGIVHDIVSTKTDADPQTKALIVKVIKGFYLKGMTLDNYKVPGSDDSVIVSDDPIPFSMIFEIDTSTDAGATTRDIYSGNTVSQDFTDAVGRIAFRYTDSVDDDKAKIYVNYNYEKSNGAKFLSTSTGANNILEVSTYIEGTETTLVSDIDFEQLHASAVKLHLAGSGDDHFSQYDDISYLDTSSSPYPYAGSGVIMTKDAAGSNSSYDVYITGGVFRWGAGNVKDTNPLQISNYANMTDDSTASTIDEIEQIDNYYFYRDDALTLKSSLVEGGTNADLIRYTVTPDLPEGLILNEKTGDITGTPTGKTSLNEYVITATTPFGSTSYAINIKTMDYFGIDYEYPINTQPPDSDIIVHKTGQKNQRTACRIMEDQINNGDSNNRDIVDIQCFVEVGEYDLRNFELNFHVKVPHNVCAAVYEEPYSFWLFKPEDSSNETYVFHNYDEDANATPPWTQGECIGANPRVYGSIQEAEAAMGSLIGSSLPTNTVTFSTSAGTTVTDQHEYFSDETAGVRLGLTGEKRTSWKSEEILFDPSSKTTRNLFFCRGDYKGGDSENGGPECDSGVRTEVTVDWSYQTDYCVAHPAHPDYTTTHFGKEGSGCTTDTEYGFCNAEPGLSHEDCVTNHGAAQWFAGIPVDPFCVADEATSNTEDCPGDPINCIAGPAVTRLDGGKAEAAAGYIKELLVQSSSADHDVITDHPEYPSAKDLSEDYVGDHISNSNIFLANYFNGRSVAAVTNMCAKVDACDTQNPTPGQPLVYTEAECDTAGDTWTNYISSIEEAYQADTEQIIRMANGGTSGGANTGYCSGNTALDETTCKGDGDMATTWIALTDGSFEYKDVQSSFHGANPFYSYSCVNGEGEFKGRIRVIVREWNRSYTLSDSVDRFNPDKTNTALGKTTRMDNNDEILLHFGNGTSTHNNFSDWDDVAGSTPKPLLPFDGTDATCSSPSLQVDGGGDDNISKALRFPGFRVYNGTGSGL